MIKFLKSQIIKKLTNKNFLSVIKDLNFILSKQTKFTKTIKIRVNLFCIINRDNIKIIT